MSIERQKEFIENYVETRIMINQKLQGMTKDELIVVINNMIEAQDGFWEGIDQAEREDAENEDMP